MAVSITTLATVFGVVTLCAPLVVAWHFRHRPVAAMIAAAERREAFHRNTLAALDAAISAARAGGRNAEADRLTPARREHVIALARLDAARDRSASR